MKKALITIPDDCPQGQWPDHSYCTEVSPCDKCPVSINHRADFCPLFSWSKVKAKVIDDERDREIQDLQKTITELEPYHQRYKSLRIRINRWVEKFDLFIRTDHRVDNDEGLLDALKEAYHEVEVAAQGLVEPPLPETRKEK